MKENSKHVPTYLKEYLNEKEIEQLESELSEEISEDAFWSKYKYEIVRRSNPIGYISDKRNRETVEKERELTDAERAALIALCENDMYLFAIRYFPHYLSLPSSSLHIYLYNFLSERFKRKRRKGIRRAIAAPRGNAKSSIVSNILPIWCVCYEKKKYIVMISDTTSQAEDFLSDVKRELEFNEKLLQDFPHIAGKGNTWRSDEIITKNNIKIYALGTGSRIRSRKFGTDRPDLIIGDDLESSEMVRSKSQREFIRNEWFAKDLMYAGDPSGSTDFLIVGTILGPHSLLNALINPEEFPDWSSKVFSAVESFSVNEGLWKEWERLYKNRFDENREQTAKLFFEKNKEKMLEGVKVLWPEGDPYYNLMIYRASNPSGFISEKMNQPLDPAKLVLPREIMTITDFSQDPNIIKILNSKQTKYFGALDPSLGKRKTADYSCIITIARDHKTGLLLVVDMDIERRSTDKQIEDIFKLNSIYNYNLFGIETNAFQVVFADVLRQKSRELGIYLKLKDIKNYSDKLLRIQGLYPLCADGTIIFDSSKLRHDAKYALSFEQITTYSGEMSSGFDDAPDALEMAIRICTRKQFKLLTKPNY